MSGSVGLFATLVKKLGTEFCENMWMVALVGNDWKSKCLDYGAESEHDLGTESFQRIHTADYIKSVPFARLQHACLFLWWFHDDVIVTWCVWLCRCVVPSCWVNQVGQRVGPGVRRTDTVCRHVIELLFTNAVCDKLNVFQSRCLRTILGVRWQDHVTKFAHDVKSSRHWLNLCGSEDLAGLDMFCFTITMTSLSTMFCFHEPITEDVDDIELWWQTWLVTSVSSATWPVKTAHCHWMETNSTAQAHRSSDKLDVTLAVSRAVKPYISTSWYQEHLSKCPQPTRTIKSWSEVKRIQLTDNSLQGCLHQSVSTVTVE